MNNRCPLTYESIPEDQKYSAGGLRKLSPALRSLADLPLGAEALRQEARLRAHKMSLQGVQIKLSAVLQVAQGRFEIVDRDGRFILKPPSELYPELPENEDLTMRLAKQVGIETPLHGLVYANDGSRTYFIKRFDRMARHRKVALEDFAQLSGHTRDTKYGSSMEEVGKIIENYCTFPVLMKRALLLRTLFNFLIGNEDMHLKNFSLITRNEKIELAPAYDFLNTTIAIGNAEEELALPLAGKKRKLQKREFIDYFAYERLKLNAATVSEILEKLKRGVPHWFTWIEKSFLTPDMRRRYAELLRQRTTVLNF